MADTPTRGQQEFGIIAALWRRDLLRLQRERSRWMGVVLQPLLFWLIIGSGMADTFAIAGAGDVDYLEWFFPGILMMIVLFTVIFATISVIEDRQSGFLQGVLVAPGSRLAMVLGKVSGVVSMTLIQSALFLALMPLAGYSYLDVNWLTLLIAVVLSSAFLTGLGICMAWALPSAQAYHALMSVVLLPAWIVSGAMFPPPEGWIQYVMMVNPLTYAVSATRGSMTSVGQGPSVGLSLIVLAG
ncbi:MAG: daunorubicin resistance ABC transporter membrane protein, partial [Myxococcota bacterium]